MWQNSAASGVARREGNVLVWVREGAPAAPASAATRSEPAPPEPRPADPPPAAPAPAGERRQISVLFCDLVDATRLSSALDPEDWREVVRSYQQAAGETITRLGGHVAQYLGDGILAYFGHPVAHEDDAERAVRAGIGIVQGIEAVDAALPRAAAGVTLQVRIGVHTGPVVVGNVGDDQQGDRSKVPLEEARRAEAFQVHGEASASQVDPEDPAHRQRSGLRGGPRRPRPRFAHQPFVGTNHSEPALPVAAGIHRRGR